jgi:hypothetical protein
VWRFVDYDGRYSAAAALEHFRQEVPKYLQWHINAWDGYGGAAVTALSRLRGEKDFIWLQGAVVELLTVATNTHPEYQGYLLTSRYEPAEASQVGSMLRVDGRKARAVLTRLAAVGFLEQVPWPPSPSVGPIPDDPSLRLLGDVAAAGKKAAQKGGAKGRFRGENTEEAFKKGERSEALAAQEKKIEGTAAAETPPAQGGQAVETDAAGRLKCPKCGHVGKPVKPLQACETATCANCGTKLQLRNTPTSTTSTNPDGRAGLAPGHTPGVSPQAGPPSVIRLQDVRASGIEPCRYSVAGNEFGVQICAAFGYSGDAAEYGNEVAHWAALYDDCEHGLMSLTPDRQAKCKVKLLKICGVVRANPGRYQCPAAYLERVLQNAIRDARRAKRAMSG